jgi:hypothetical protein
MAENSADQLEKARRDARKQSKALGNDQTDRYERGDADITVADEGRDHYFQRDGAWGGARPREGTTRTERN